MPYTLKDAPPRNVLPKGALKVWVSTFNSVYDETGDEDQARQAAWSNVKKAGYEKGEDGKWHKASAEIADTAAMAVEDVRLLDRAAALALPLATPSKVYAEFRLLSFGTPNSNHDAFATEDIDDHVIEALIGSPIYLDADADEHPAKDRRATDRAQFQAGTITQAERREDGVYCVGAFQRDILEDRGIEPKRLADYSVSMEVMFDRAKARYRCGDTVLPYTEALAQGVASPLGIRDDPAKYDARNIVPLEFHAAALLVRGRNADRTADVLRAAATEEADMADEIFWSEDDIEALEEFLGAAPDAADAAELKSKERKKLPKSDFAYVDPDGEGHLPIHDAMHVKNALARLNQTDIPLAAKRKALKKIMRAAKKFGIKVDKDSDVVKQYGGSHDALEDKLQAVRDAFYKRYGNIDGEYCYVLKTYSDYLIASAGTKLFRVDYKAKDDGYDFKEPREVEIVYKTVKKEAASMAEDGTKEPEILTPERQKEIEDAAVAAARPAIVKEAVEAYLAGEKAFADRIKVLDEISPVTEAEKADLEKKVREADEAGYTAIKMERMQAALAEARKGKAVADKDPKPAPALRGGAEPPKGDARTLLHVTIQE